MNSNSGQVMLLTVLILSGLLLSASTIGGLLMLYQIRQSADIVQSTRAIYAADTGIERRLYEFLKVDKGSLTACNDTRNYTLDTGSTIQVSCTLDRVEPQVGVAGSETLIIKSTGESRKNYRALEITLGRDLPALPPPPPPPPAP